MTAKPPRTSTTASAASREPCPKCLLRALQALAFWVGYQHQRLHRRPPETSGLTIKDGRTLFEGAIGDELARLLQAYCCEHFVFQEILYRQLIDGNTKAIEPDFGESRVDLTVFKANENERFPVTTQVGRNSIATPGLRKGSGSR